MLTRRSFGLGLTSAAFAGLASACASPRDATDALARLPGYRTGPMLTVRRDGPRMVSHRIPIPTQTEARPLFVDMELAEGFDWELVSHLGQPMADGLVVPDAADGMGSFDVGGGRVVLVRNHELKADARTRGAFHRGGRRDISRAFDRDGDTPLPGGTTTLVYDYINRRLDRQHLSLSGTIRNCAGGATPWGTWLSCEEDVSRRTDRFTGETRHHGWVFEVDAGAADLGPPRQLPKLGRFNHEAAAVDPRSGIVYLTEDRVDGLFYRFVPQRAGDLSSGRLQALAMVRGMEGIDLRNWRRAPGIRPGQPHPVRWITLDNVESLARDDLRDRGRRLGAARFACGEGVHFGHDEIFFCCTSGGAIRSGQIIRYRPSPNEGCDGEDRSPGTLELFLEVTDPGLLNFCDNIVVAPNGHLIVCEDPYVGGEGNYLFRGIAAALGMPPAPSCLRGVTPEGEVYDIAKLRNGSELAGICFGPDGQTMFVNVYSPTATLALRTPVRWEVQNDWSIPRADGHRSAARSCQA